MRALGRARAEGLRELQTPRGDSTRVSCSTLSGRLVRPPGARPTSGGSAQWSGPPRPRRSDSTQPAARARTTPHGLRVWNQNVPSPGRPGGAPRASTPARPCVGCQAPSPGPPGLHAAPSPVLIPPDPCGTPWASHLRQTQRASGVNREVAPRRATARPAVLWGKGPGPLAPRPQAAGSCHDAWSRGPSLAKLSVGRPRYDSVHAPDSAAPEGKRPPRGAAPARAPCVP
jgi:hypothetical protein